MSIRNVRPKIFSLVATVATLFGTFGVAIYAPRAATSFANTLAAPIITSPTSPTTVSSPTVAVSGTGIAGASIGVFDGTALVGTATVDGSDNWATVLDLLKSSTAHSLTAEQSVSGQTSPQSSPAVLVTVTSNEVTTNGSFEQPVIGSAFVGATNNGTWANYSQGIPGWSATNGQGIELQNQSTLGVAPKDGYQYAELNSNGPSGVAQNLATVPGGQYILTFAYMARPNTPASDNTMAVQWNGSYIAGSASVGSGLQGQSSWTVQQYAVTATGSSTALEFDSTVASGSLGDFLDAVSLIPDAAIDPNTSWLDASLLSPPGTVSTQQAIDFQGEGLWYKFPVTPGQQLTIGLSNLPKVAFPGDYNIAVFSDIGEAFKALTPSTLNLAALGAEAPGSAASPSAFSPSAFSPSAFSPSAFSPSAFSPSAFSPSAFSPSAFSPSAFSPSAFSPSAFSSAYSSAQLDSLLAVSTTPGAVDKSVTVDTWNNTGDFYVRITGNNGAFAPFVPYSLTVTSNGGPCQGVTLNTYSGDPTISGAGGPSYSTVIVTNSSAMPDVTSGPLNTALTQLAQATNGAVVDLKNSTKVMELQTQAANNPGCPYAPDLTAAAIQDIINSYRTGLYGTNLQNVVIVGDDNVIPFFRYPDNAGLAGEFNYQPPLLSTSSPEAALANNYYLSDDQFGAANELTIQGVTVPLATAAVGRLVESPADILSTVNNYLGGHQTISPTSSLSTGYDFMAPPATQIATTFSNGIGGTGNSTLINNTWTATDLQNALFGGHHDLAFLGGHFSANNLLAADETTTMTTNQFASLVGNTLNNSLVLGAGCHSGYNIDPSAAIPGVTDTLDWPQAFAEAGSTLIAGTGYQYGDTNYTAYSDQLYVDIAQQLGYQPANGPGPVPIGLAMLTAKQKYLSGVVQLNGIEEKALLETTLYGLPMTGVQEPNQVNAPGGSSPIATANAIASNPGVQLGLQEADVNFGGSATGAFSGTPVFSLTSTAVNQGGNTYTYDSGAQGVTAAPGGPVLPVQTYDVNVPNQTLRGVGFFGGSYTDTNPVNPLTGDPATETGNPQVVPFSSPVFFPQTGWNPNYFGTLLSGGATDLSLTPVQYVSGATGTTMRTYGNEALRLFYSNNTSQFGANVPALAAPPSISGVTSNSSGTTVNVSANVTGDPSAGIQDVWVTYTGLTSGDPNYGQWQSVPLTQSLSDSTLWNGSLLNVNPSDTVFIVQAVNGVGEVSMDNNNGYYFTPGVTPGAPLPPSANAYTLALGGATSGAYLGTAQVTANLTNTTVNGPGAGQPITFTLGPTTVTATTGSNGIATASIPLIEPPGTYSLAASFAGDSNDQPAATQNSFQINPAGTAITLSSPAQITSGTSSGATATLTSGNSPLAQKPVYFVVTQSSTVVGASVGITNSHGVAQAGVITTAAGAVGPATLTAYFGSAATPLPDGTTYNATDPDYSGSTSSGAALSLLDATATSLVAKPNPYVLGNTLTLTAQVSVVGVNGTPPVLNSGTVSFSQDGSPIAACASQPVTSGQATCTAAAMYQGGIQSFSATYSGTGYSGSTGTTSDSPGFSQTISGTYSGSLTVSSGQLVLITGTVTGSVTVNKGGGLEVVGGTIDGQVSSTGATVFTLCNATLLSSLSVSSSTGFVFIGGGTGTGCGPTTISGSTSLSKNTGGVEIANSTVNASVSVSGNTLPSPLYPGTPNYIEVAGNTIAGALSCNKNSSVGDAGQLNTSPNKSGQCTNY